MVKGYKGFKLNEDAEKMMLRAIMVEIIRQATKDYLKPVAFNTRGKVKEEAKESIRNDAKEFLASETCMDYCEALNFDHNIILKMLEGSVYGNKAIS